MTWKYKQYYANCRCDKCQKKYGLRGKTILFTGLTPMFTPITADDYKKYHDNIDFVLFKLRLYDFDNFHIHLYSHIDIKKEIIQKRLPTETIIK